MRKKLGALSIALSVMLWGSAQAKTLLLMESSVIGDLRHVAATTQDTLLDMARRYSIGHDEMVHANPGVDRWIPGNGTAVLVPEQYVLPSAPRQGIVVNLPEMRLYYYPGDGTVTTYPVSVGRMDWNTPLGELSIISKIESPSWRPPQSIIQEAAEQGRELPKIVPPGPDNPLGDHALRLSMPSYLIHGTNRPAGVGMRVTHGCVRMYPENIASLFDRVSRGTSVHFINQPIKVGRDLDGEIFVEVHAPLEEEGLQPRDLLDHALQALETELAIPAEDVDRAELWRIVSEASGVPALLPQNSVADSLF